MCVKPKNRISTGVLFFFYKSVMEKYRLVVKTVVARNTLPKREKAKKIMFLLKPESTSTV